MKVRELLEGITEAPLPSEWDQQVYTPQTSYKKRIDYAVARAQKLGKGSSRSAFEIPYQGRMTVLKVAHNTKGMAQNKAEAELLSDGYLSSLDIVIPIIDYDEEHQQPVWIHTEKALKATPKQLCEIMKCPSLNDLVNSSVQAYTGETIGGDVLSKSKQVVAQKWGEDAVETFLEYVDKLQELQQFNIKIRDFDRAANWGLYNGNPVVIDLGLTSDVSKKYYEGRG